MKGPATNFFKTQEAIVSVTLEPWIMAFAEFFMKQAPRFSDWKAGAPVVRYSMLFVALLTSDVRRSFELLSTSEARALMLMLVSGWGGIWKLGKDSQNGSGAGDE